MLSKLRHALRNVRTLFSDIQESSLDDIEEMLIRADVGVAYAATIMERVKKHNGDVVAAMKMELVAMLSIPRARESDRKPLIVMVSGVNGSGKTTTVAKLAYRYAQHRSVLLVCGDTYRDAASEQLEIWAEQAHVDVVTSQRGQDAAAVVFDAVSKAQAKGLDVVLIDTAGRLHTRDDLMAELRKIERVVHKFNPAGPDLNLLTIDANLGLNSVQQARSFSRQIGINGLVLTKFDGTSKGGAVIPICGELKVPVLYLGIGERIEDIIEFEPDAFVEAIFE